MSSEPSLRLGDTSAEYLGGLNIGAEIPRTNELTPTPVNGSETVGDAVAFVYDQKVSIAAARENIRGVHYLIENPPSVTREAEVAPRGTAELNNEHSPEQIGHRLEAARKHMETLGLLR